MTQNPNNAISRALGPTDTANLADNTPKDDHTANRYTWLDETTMAEIIAAAEKKMQSFCKNKTDETFPELGRVATGMTTLHAPSRP